MDRVKFLTERQSSLATDLENALLLTQTHASSGEIGAIFKSLVETNVAVILEIAYWRRIQWCPSPVLVRPAGEDKNAKKLTIQSKLRKQVSQILPNLQKHLPMLEASSPDHLAFFLAPCFTFDQAKSYFVGELKAVFTIEQIFIAARNIFFLEDGVASTYRSFHPKGSSSSLTVSPYKSFPVLRLVYPGFSFPTEQFKWFWDADSVYQSSSEVLIHSVGQIGTKPLFHLGSSSTVQGNVQTVGFLQQQQQEKQKEEDEQAALRFPESSLADVSYTMDHGVLSAPYFMLPDQLEAGSSVQVVSMVAALMGEEGGPQSLTPPPSAATAKALAAKNKEEQELQQLEEELALAKLRTEEKRQLQLQLQQEEEALALSLAEEKQRLDNLLRLERERSAAKAQAEETLRRQKEEELAAAKADVEERRAAAKAEAEEKQRREKEERATAKAEMKKQEDEEKRRGAELKKQQEDDKKRIAAAAAPSSKKTSTKQSQPSSRPQQQPQQQSENISRLEEEVALTKARAEEKLREEAALTLSLAEEKRRLEEQEKLRQDSLLRLGAELAQTKARAEENLRLQRAEEEALALSLAEEKQRLNNLLRLERERSAAKVQAEAEETLRRQTEEEERRTSSAAQKKAASSAAVVAAAAAAASATATTAITTTSTTAELRLQSSPHHEHVSRKFVAALVQDGLTSTVATRSRSVSPTEREPPVSPSPAGAKHPHLVAAAKEVSTPFAASSVPDDTPSSDPPRVRSSPIISKGHAVLRDSSFGTINLNLALNSRQSFSPKDILGAENKRWRALRCGSKKVAVVIIQTRMRMVLAKKKAARKRESLNEERRHNKRVKALADPTNKRTNAAVMIQRHARGMWSRTRVFLLIKAAMVLNTAYRRNQSFVHLRRNLRRIERPLLITVRGLLNVPASVYNSSSTLRVKVSVYWSPMLHILHASEVKQVIQGKFPQFTMTTAASELKRVFTPEEQEARMRANMSRTSSMMFSLRSSSPRADAENEGNDDDDDSSSSSSEGDPEKVEEESASTKYRLYLKLPKITKSIKSVTSKLTRRFSSAIVPKVKRPTIPGTAKCMSVFDETIKVPSCHGNSAIKFEILNDANRRVTSAVFLLAQHGRLMFWEAEEKIPLPLGTMRRLIAGSDGNTQKMLEALDSPMLEVSVRSGAALRSKAGWGKLRIHGHGPIRAAIGASKDAQIINFVWEVWNRFYFSLDGGVLGAYAGKNVCEPIFTVECASITSCVSEKGEMIILEEGVARTSTDDSHNVFITIKNSIETLIFRCVPRPSKLEVSHSAPLLFLTLLLIRPTIKPKHNRFGDSGSRVQWVECLSKIVEDNEKTEAEEDVKAASAKPGQGSPPQRRGSNNMPASSEKAPSSSTKSISGDGQPGPSLQSPTSSSSSAASLQLPDLERQARQASRRSSSATPAGVKNTLPGVDSESLKALQSYHHKAQSFRSK